MRPGKASEVKRTWLGPGVMQIVQGAPGVMAPVVEVGLLPTAGRASAGAGTAVGIWRGKFPSGSKTWVRRVGRGGAGGQVFGGRAGGWGGWICAGGGAGGGPASGP